MTAQKRHKSGMYFRGRKPDHISGDRAVLISVLPEDGNSAVTVLVRPQYGNNKLNISLEHTYEFAAWAKWQGRGLPPEIRLNLPETVVTKTKTGQGSADAQGWRRLWIRAGLKETAQPNYLAVWVQGPGTAWLDDLSLREVLSIREVPAATPED